MTKKEKFITPNQREKVITTNERKKTTSQQPLIHQRKKFHQNMRYNQNQIKRHHQQKLWPTEHNLFAWSSNRCLLLWHVHLKTHCLRKYWIQIKQKTDSFSKDPTNPKRACTAGLNNERWYIDEHFAQDELKQKVSHNDSMLPYKTCSSIRVFRATRPVPNTQTTSQAGVEL